MSWFKRPDRNDEPNLDRNLEPNLDPLLDSSTDADADVSADNGTTRVRTEGLWIKCPGCRAPLFKADLEANLSVCPKCGHHFKIGARQRIDLLLEPGYTFVDGNLYSTDPLNFTDIKPYKQRLAAAQKQTGLNDAIITALGHLGHHAVVFSAMEYAFIGGSMGAVVGEMIARAIDRSLATRHASGNHLGFRRRTHAWKAPSVSCSSRRLAAGLDATR